MSVVENFEDDPINKYADVFDKCSGKASWKGPSTSASGLSTGYSSSQESTSPHQRKIQGRTFKVAGTRGHCSHP